MRRLLLLLVLCVGCPTSPADLPDPADDDDDTEAPTPIPEALSITALSPSPAPGGAPFALTIEGTAFTDATAVALDGQPLSATLEDGVLLADAPALARGVHEVTVTDEGATASANLQILRSAALTSLSGLDVLEEVGGTIVLAGVKSFRPVAKFVSDKVVFKELRLMGAFGVTTTAYAKAVDLIHSGTVPLEKMHTHDFALTDAETAIRTLAREIPGDESIHSCLIPEL